MRLGQGILAIRILNEQTAQRRKVLEDTAVLSCPVSFINNKTGSKPMINEDHSKPKSSNRPLTGNYQQSSARAPEDTESGSDAGDQKLRQSTPNTQPDTFSDILPPLVTAGGAFILGYLDEIHGPGSRLTQYRPSIFECQKLAEHWVQEIVGINAEWVHWAQTGSCNLRMKRYALSKLEQILELGIIRPPELNHMFYVERKKNGLKFEDGEICDDGAIEHPKWWLKERNQWRRSFADGKEVPDEWKPFMDPEDTTDEPKNDDFLGSIDGGLGET